MEPFLTRLRSGPTLVGDGATGTLLMERGLPPGRPPEEATLTHPEWVAEVARRYVEAGAEVAETNTFGASPLKLALAGIGEEVERVNRDAVRLAREGAGGKAYVVASCGPCGRLLEPYGDAPPAAVHAGFLVQVGILATAGVDAVFIETMTDLEEAKLAVRAAREAAPALPVAAMMTFEKTPRGFYTIMGDSVADAAAALEEAGADAVGSNCGNGIGEMVEIAREFRRHSALPVVIQPNAGLPRLCDGHLIYDESPESMADRARELVAIGVALIGGCCGTTPDHIRALRSRIQRHAPPPRRPSGP
ncbi:MAG TPA: homocysteine S-methyltransferase family protein [Longimicrobiales bacterium]|nr:homocysteine S-methyltransferase family protein [Longimicrobiales bacterium]